MHKRLLFLLSVVCSGVLLFACQAPERAAATPQVSIGLDWVPSAEYYGIYVARFASIDSSEGVKLHITNGSGAAVVAQQLAANQMRLGTTTSDNVVLQIAKGANFHAIYPILAFNPSAIVYLSGSGIRGIADLRGKRLGVNRGSSVYGQFKTILAANGLTYASLKEVPIGFGGTAELLSGKTDAILAYTTNQGIDLHMRDERTRELLFDSLGVHSMGLVLVLADSAPIAGLPSGQIAGSVARAIERGYQLGAEHPEIAVAALRAVNPSLDSARLLVGVRRVAQLRKGITSVADSSDAWLGSSDSLSAARAVFRRLIRPL